MYSRSFPCSSLRQFNYQNGEKWLVLEPLTGEIDPESCNFTVGKVKVEVRVACLIKHPFHLYVPPAAGAAIQKGPRKVGQVSERQRIR